MKTTNETSCPETILQHYKSPGISGGWFKIAERKPEKGRSIDIQYANGTIAKQRIVTDENLQHYINHGVIWRPSNRLF